MADPSQADGKQEALNGAATAGAMSVAGTNQAPTTKAPESIGKPDSEDGAKSLKRR